MIDSKMQISSVPPDQHFLGTALQGSSQSGTKASWQRPETRTSSTQHITAAPMHIYGSPPDLQRPEETLEYDRTTTNGARSARSHPQQSLSICRVQQAQVSSALPSSPVPVDHGISRYSAAQILPLSPTQWVTTQTQHQARARATTRRR